MLRPFQGHVPRLGARVYIAPTAVVIGDVELGDDVSVWPGAVIRGDVAPIRIGARSNIQDNAVIHVTHAGPYAPGGGPCRIGADVTVGHGAIIHACSVHHGCLIGMHATVLDGAETGPFAFVGAGALVPPGRRVPRGELWVGNPARRLRALDADGEARLLYSAAHYVALKDAYRAGEPAPD